MQVGAMLLRTIQFEVKELVSIWILSKIYCMIQLIKWNLLVADLTFKVYF